MSDSPLHLRIPDDVGHINLRADPRQDDLRKTIEAVLGQSLPAANTLSDGEQRVFWLGPNEWLVTANATRTAHLFACLNESLQDRHTAINDISGGNIVLQLTGEAARELFSKGCTLDFHPDVFKVGDCAQSGLAKATVLFGLIDAAPTFEVIVRRSYADYLLAWLRRAGRECDIEFV